MLPASISNANHSIDENRCCFCYHGRVKEIAAVFEFKTFDEMYSYLLANAKTKKEVFVKISRKKPEKCDDILSYYDAVNAALCFGWIDSTLRNVDGVLVQRFSPRKKNSHWTETNIERCRELDKKGLMREEGKRACPRWGDLYTKAAISYKEK